ncbi:MAG: hypothetical protein Kow0090_18920 [Myxococcota bacterium]
MDITLIMAPEQTDFNHIIPNKLYFRIGEVSRLLRVKPSVLRYWESEFFSIKPSKSTAGQRLYRRTDVEKLLIIKHLLYERRYTIEGARKYLARRHQAEEPVNLAETADSFKIILNNIKSELDSIGKIIDGELKNIEDVIKQSKKSPPQSKIKKPVPPPSPYDSKPVAVPNVSIHDVIATVKKKK